MADAKSVMAQAEKEKSAMGRLLLSADGARLMTELETEFDGDNMVASSVEMTYFNLGARHVYRLLKNLRASAEKG